MTKYESEISCPKCGANNDGPQENVQTVEDGEYMCHECEHLWECPIE